MPRRPRPSKPPASAFGWKEGGGGVVRLSFMCWHSWAGPGGIASCLATSLVHTFKDCQGLRGIYLYKLLWRPTVEKPTMLHAAVAVALLSVGANAFVTGPAFTATNGRIAPLAGMRLRAPAVVAAAPRTRAARGASQGLRMAAVAPAGLDTAALSRAATEARGLAMDSIAKAHSGHLGLPLGCAEVSSTISVLIFSVCDCNYTLPCSRLRFLIL
jgi:hypothetical protein